MGLILLTKTLQYINKLLFSHMKSINIYTNISIISNYRLIKNKLFLIFLLYAKKHNYMTLEQGERVRIEL